MFTMYFAGIFELQSLFHSNIESNDQQTIQYLNVILNYLLFQWTYRTANSWGTDPDGTSCVGCGKQEHFRACADIAIARDGNPDPPTTLNPIPSTTKNPVATTANDPVTDAPCTNGGTRNYKRVCCKKENY